MKKTLVFFFLFFILISFSANLTDVATQSETNATKAIILYNLAISQMAAADYTDAFENLKRARELLPTITSVVNDFQKIYDSVKYNYTKQMIVINKLKRATPTTVKKESSKVKVSNKPLLIYGFLGFLLFFSLTYSLLYFVEIKKAMISSFFINSVVALASKYGYSKTASEEEEYGEDEEEGDIIEIEEVDQEESGKVEKEITPEDVEDENVEEILSQLLGINEDEEPSNKEFEDEEELDIEEESQEKESADDSEEKKKADKPKDMQELSSDEESTENTYLLKIDSFKDPRNDVEISIERLKEEMHQIIAALKEKDIKNQDELDNALKIMYVYATASNVKSNEAKGGEENAE